MISLSPVVINIQHRTLWSPRQRDKALAINEGSGVTGRLLDFAEPSYLGNQLPAEPWYMKVLIVEDDILISMYFEMLIAEFGHEVCAIATSAGDAITRAGTYRPDVTLMDIRLADGSSGIDAAREIHARYGLRCIFISGTPDEATRAAVAAYEPIDFLGKPVMSVVLQRALEKARET